LCTKDEIRLNQTIPLVETPLWPAPQLENSNLWLKAKGLCVFYLLDGFETNQPVQLGRGTARADGSLSIGSQHHLPEIAKSKGHLSRF